MTPAAASDLADITWKSSSVAHLLITSPARKGNSPGKKLIFFSLCDLNTRLVASRLQHENPRQKISCVLRRPAAKVALVHSSDNKIKENANAAITNRIAISGAGGRASGSHT
jgi:hypothetical protein